MDAAREVVLQKHFDDERKPSEWKMKIHSNSSSWLVSGWAWYKRLWAGLCVGVVIGAIVAVANLEAAASFTDYLTPSLAVFLVIAVSCAVVSPETWLSNECTTVAFGIRVCNVKVSIFQDRIAINDPIVVQWFEELPRTRSAGWYVAIQTVRSKKYWIGCSPEKSGLFDLLDGFISNLSGCASCEFLCALEKKRDEWETGAQSRGRAKGSCR